MAIKPKEVLSEKLYSISQLAEVSGFDRRTVTDRLNGCTADGKRRGHDVWTLETAGPAVWGGSGYKKTGDAPGKPSDRKAFYESENARLKFEAATRELIPAQEVRDGFSAALKALDHSLSCLDDDVEREEGFTPEQIVALKIHIDNMRAQVTADLRLKDD